MTSLRRWLRTGEKTNIFKWKYLSFDLMISYDPTEVREWERFRQLTIGDSSMLTAKDKMIEDWRQDRRDSFGQRFGKNVIWKCILCDESNFCKYLIYILRQVTPPRVYEEICYYLLYIWGDDSICISLSSFSFFICICYHFLNYTKNISSSYLSHRTWMLCFKYQFCWLF